MHEIWCTQGLFYRQHDRLEEPIWYIILESGSAIFRHIFWTNIITYGKLYLPTGPCYTFLRKLNPRKNIVYGLNNQVCFGAKSAIMVAVSDAQVLISKLEKPHHFIIDKMLIYVCN